MHSAVDPTVTAVDKSIINRQQPNSGLSDAALGFLYVVHLVACGLPVSQHLLGDFQLARPAKMRVTHSPETKPANVRHAVQASTPS